MSWVPSPPPAQTRMVDNRGLVTLPWLMYFQSRSAFTDRGDPTLVDKAIGDLTLGAWTEWDLSGIVPAGATAVLLRVTVYNTGAGWEVDFRRKGHTNNHNLSRTCGLINLPVMDDLIVACDSDRVIEYYVLNSGVYASLDVVVGGWWK